MMKHEFEQLAGYEVSYRDYEEIIEPMYMAVDLDKDEFVKLLDRKRFALRKKQAIILEIKLDAQELKKNCTLYTDTEIMGRLERNVDELTQRFGDARIEYGQMFSCYYPSTLVLNGKYIAIA